MVRVIAVVMVGWIMGLGPVQGQELVADPLVYSAQEMFGEPVISANPDLVNSTSNEYGPWGSPDFVNSLANEYGPLGSPDFVYSAGNEYGQGVRVRPSEEALAQVPGLAAAIEAFGEPVISANPDLVNSTSNPYGPWGSPDSVYSFTNEYGPVGSRDAVQGVNNEYGTGLKMRIVDPFAIEPAEILSHEHGHGLKLEVSEPLLDLDAR